MRKILFFYNPESKSDAEIKAALQEYKDTHELRIVPKQVGTASYFLKHGVKSTPTVIILNEVDRQLRKQSGITVNELKNFI